MGHAQVRASGEQPGRDRQAQSGDSQDLEIEAANRVITARVDSLDTEGIVPDDNIPGKPDQLGKIKKQMNKVGAEIEKLSALIKAKAKSKKRRKKSR